MLGDAQPPSSPAQVGPKPHDPSAWECGHKELRDASDTAWTSPVADPGCAGSGVAAFALNNVATGKMLLPPALTVGM